MSDQYRAGQMAERERILTIFRNIPNDTGLTPAAVIAKITHEETTALAIGRTLARAKASNIIEQWIADCPCEKDGWHDCITCDTLRDVNDEILEKA